MDIYKSKKKEKKKNGKRKENEERTIYHLFFIIPRRRDTLLPHIYVVLPALTCLTDCSPGLSFPYWREDGEEEIKALLWTEDGDQDDISEANTSYHGTTTAHLFIIKWIYKPMAEIIIWEKGKKIENVVRMKTQDATNLDKNNN